MEISGIVAEFNPFHNGHKLLLDTAGEGADGVICVMSGNCVQRGDFAILEKHARAKAAVQCGADLVLELPLPYALSSAEGFAEGGVRILAATGLVTKLVFGSECGDAERLANVAEAVLSPEFDEKVVSESGKGLPYAAARQRALESMGCPDAELISEPNNLLAVEYIKALKRIESPIRPVTVKREGAGHDARDARGRFASGTKLRELFDELAVSELDRYIPAEAMDIFYAEMEAGRAPVFLADCDRAVLARLRTMTDAEFEALPGAGEGLYRRFMKAARELTDIDDILESTGTKRYAMSRVRRMLISAYIGLKAEDVPEAPPYIRVLAMNSRGRELLHMMNETAELPIVTKPAHVRKLEPAAQHIFELEARATDLFTLAYPVLENSAGGSEWTRGPEITENF